MAVTSLDSSDTYCHIWYQKIKQSIGMSDTMKIGFLTSQNDLFVGMSFILDMLTEWDDLFFI